MPSREFFPPQEYNEYLLIDGGILDPVPACAARALAPRLPVVAVNLSSPLGNPSTPPSLQIPGVTPLVDQLVARLNITQALQVFAEAIDLGQSQITTLRLQIEKPEVLINPAVGGIGLLDNVDVHEVSKLGEIVTLEALPALQRAVSWPARLRRSWRAKVLWLARLVPYLAVGFGLFFFKNAWLALLGYHLGILLFLGLNRAFGRFRALRLVLHPGWAASPGLYPASPDFYFIWAGTNCFCPQIPPFRWPLLG